MAQRKTRDWAHKHHQSREHADRSEMLAGEGDIRNKRKSMTGDAQVEANLEKVLSVHLHFRKHVALALTVSDILKFHIFFTLKRYVKIIRCNFRSGIIRFQIFKSLEVVSCIFAISLAVSELSTF